MTCYQLIYNYFIHKILHYYLVSWLLLIAGSILCHRNLGFTFRHVALSVVLYQKGVQVNSSF